MYDETFYSCKFEDAPCSGKLNTTRPKKKDGGNNINESWAESREENYSEIEDDYNDEMGQVDERDDDDDLPDEFRDNDIDDLDVEISNKEN